MKHLSKILLLSISILGFSSAAAKAAIFRADVGSLSGSGVSGTVLLDLSEDSGTLTVTTNATGLEPNQDHVQHIHGLFSSSGEIADSMTPTIANDSDGDGFVELGEGAPVYGPIILPLATINTPDGSASVTTTYDLSDPSVFGTNRATNQPFTAADLMPLTFREIVIHGRTVAAGIGSGTPGEVNGDGGYLAVLPVAAGEIVADNDAASVPEPGTNAALALMGVASGALILRRRHTLAINS
ncbi:MAG: PEP-CTERM sorting domain-containing protein [Phormidesmis sp.]